MITEKVTVLKAEENMILTNGESFGKVVYLGKNDSSDNWQEITDEEAEALQRASDDKNVE